MLPFTAFARIPLCSLLLLPLPTSCKFTATFLHSQRLKLLAACSTSSLGRHIALKCRKQSERFGHATRVSYQPCHVKLAEIRRDEGCLCPLQKAGAVVRPASALTPQRVGEMFTNQVQIRLKLQITEACQGHCRWVHRSSSTIRPALTSLSIRRTTSSASERIYTGLAQVSKRAVSLSRAACASFHKLYETGAASSMQR